MKHSSTRPSSSGSYKTGPIIIGVLGVIFLVGIAFFVFYRTHYIKHEEGGRFMRIRVENSSMVPHTLTFADGSTKTLLPGQSENVNITQHDVIATKGEYPNGMLSETSIRIKNPQITHVFITDGGIRTNLSVATRVNLQNKAPFEIVISEVVNGIILPGVKMKPFSVIDADLIATGSQWAVFHPKDPDAILDTLTITGRPTLITFDGSRLTSE